MTALSVAPSPVVEMKPCRMTSASGVTYELMFVTPEQAEQWLGKNVGNRRLRKALYTRYSRDLAERRWRENGASIVRAKDGTLLDGQHRLHAIVVAGVGAWMLVVQNVDPVAQPTIDDGAKRTLADRLTFRGEVNSHRSAAVVRRVMLWENGYAFNSGAYQPTSQEQLDFIEGNDRVTAAVGASSLYAKRKLLPPATIGLCWYVFSALDADACAEFFDRLDDGANLSFNHPIMVLRNRLIDITREPGRGASDDIVLHYVFKTWNLYRAKKPASVLRIGPNEKFPTPR